MLPQPDGRPSAVVVRSAGSEVVLDKPYATTEVGSRGGQSQSALSAEEVRARYGSTLSALPPRPVQFTVHFTPGGDQLTEEAHAIFENIRAILAKRHTPDIRVIGHTDRVGSLTENDALSLRRAKVVRDELHSFGIKTTRPIEATGRGEREPLIPTADEVDEPRNRRVVIEIR